MVIRTCPYSETAAVVRLDGRLGVETGTALRDAVYAALGVGRHQVVLNLAGMSAVDAAGLGQLVQSLEAVRASGGELKLVLRQRGVLELMTRTNLLRLFEVFPSESEALAGIGSAAVATC
jgi:anti-anti-sigma factor